MFVIMVIPVANTEEGLEVLRETSVFNGPAELVKDSEKATELFGSIKKILGWGGTR